MVLSRTPAPTVTFNRLMAFAFNAASALAFQCKAFRVATAGEREEGLPVSPGETRSRKWPRAVLVGAAVRGGRGL